MKSLYKGLKSFITGTALLLSIVAVPYSTMATGSEPVRGLLTFTAIVHGQFVKLEWSTSGEENIDYFSVERSSNGTDFEEILLVRATGNTNGISQYQIEDKEPLAIDAFYRLKHVGFNGKVTYYQIIPFRSAGSSQ